MSLRALLESMRPDAKSKRQIEATARWKAKNPQKVKAQRARWRERRREREASLEMV